MNPQRRNLIRATLPLVGYVHDKNHNPIRDKNNLPTRLIVPGSEGNRYDVILKWDTQHATVESECRHDVNLTDCLGNDVSICKHVLSAVIRALHDRGKHVSVCKDADSAKNLSHIGGQVIRIYSKQSKRYIYGVVKDVKHG